MMTRTCTVCGKKKETTDFLAKRRICRACYNEQQRSRRAHLKRIRKNEWKTWNEISILKLLSPEAKKNYLATMHLRDNWDELDPNEIKEFLQNELGGQRESK